MSMNQEEMAWQCRGCDNYNCLHTEYCKKCRGSKQFLNLRAVSLLPYLPPLLQPNEDNYVDEAPQVPSILIAESSPPPSLSNNIILSSNIIQHEPPSSVPSVPSVSAVGGRQFNCDVCNQNFPSRNTLYYHRRKHVDSSEERLKCTHCKLTYQKKSQFALQKHLQKNHNLTAEQAQATVSDLLRANVPPPAEPAPLELKLSILNVVDGVRSPLRIRDVNALISAIKSHMDRKYSSVGKLFKDNKELNLGSPISVLTNNDEIEYRVSSM